MRISLVVILIVATISDAFYLPGLAPNVFCKKETPDSKCKVTKMKKKKRKKNELLFLQSKLEVFVNRLDSVESVLPYEYT